MAEKKRISAHIFTSESPPTYFHSHDVFYFSHLTYARPPTSQAPINVFQTGVANYSAAYWGSADPRFGACAMSWFVVWSKGNALTGTVNFEGHVTRKLLFSGIVMSYLRIQNAPSLKATDTAIVEAWLSRVGNIVHTEYTTTYAAVVSNHMYTAGECATKTVLRRLSCCHIG